MNTRFLRITKSIILIAVASILVAACQPSASTGSPKTAPTSAPTVSGANQPPVSTFTISVVDNAKLGKILVDDKGMTLYTFKNDSTDVSKCTGGCAELWPPLTVSGTLVPSAGPGATGKLGVITRDDGTMQVTYNGWPLYTYVADSVPGDVNGQGIDGLWSAATP